LTDKQEKKDNLENLDVNLSIILKCVSNKGTEDCRAESFNPDKWGAVIKL
jgi:hypothetical protein